MGLKGRKSTRAGVSRADFGQLSAWTHLSVKGERAGIPVWARGLLGCGPLLWLGWFGPLRPFSTFFVFSPFSFPVSFLKQKHLNSNLIQPDSEVLQNCSLSI
jgi:hypothetical protein